MRRGRGWHGEHCPLLMSPVKPTNYYPTRGKGCVRACCWGNDLSFVWTFTTYLYSFLIKSPLGEKKNANRRAVNSPGFNYVGAVALTAANLLRKRCRLASNPGCCKEYGVETVCSLFASTELKKKKP